MFCKVANEDLSTSGWQRYLAFTLLSSREIYTLVLFVMMQMSNIEVNRHGGYGHKILYNRRPTCLNFSLSLHG